MAPEILYQRPYNQACDVFSIGVVLFAMLSGSFPFYSEDRFELFDKIKRCDYNFENEVWQDVSDEVKDLISKMLVADP